jgi:hypothetical protein
MVFHAFCTTHPWQKQVKLKNIDVYLQSLIDELQELRQPNVPAWTY